MSVVQWQTRLNFSGASPFKITESALSPIKVEVESSAPAEIDDDDVGDKGLDSAHASGEADATRSENKVVLFVVRSLVESDFVSHRLPEVGETLQARRATWTKWYKGTVTKVSEMTIDVTLELGKSVLSGLSRDEWRREGDVKESKSADSDEPAQSESTPTDSTADAKTRSVSSAENAELNRVQMWEEKAEETQQTGFVDEALVYYPVGYGNTKKVVAKQRKNAQKRSMILNTSGKRSGTAVAGRSMPIVDEPKYEELNSDDPFDEDSINDQLFKVRLDRSSLQRKSR